MGAFQALISAERMFSFMPPLPIFWVRDMAARPSANSISISMRRCETHCAPRRSFYIGSAGRRRTLRARPVRSPRHWRNCSSTQISTPHGEVQRPIFAYATIAALCLASITATGDAIMRQTVAPKKESADDLQHVVMGIAASTKGVTLSELRVDVAAGGEAVRLSGLVESPSAGNALSKSIKSALGNVTVTSHFLFAQPSDLLTAQLNPSLLQFSLAGMGRTPLTTDDVDGTVETAVANLGNFDSGAATKIGAFKRFDLTFPYPTLDLQRKDLASGLLQGVPVSVTDQG